MKIRHDLAIHSTGRRSQPEPNEPKNVLEVRLRLTIEDAQRGDAVATSIETLMKRSTEQIAATLDRRPF